MVRALSAMPRITLRRLGDGSLGRRLGGAARLVVVVALVIISGCAIVPRSRMDECQKLTQSLRADNARLKDRVLALQGQNRDYAERAVDDARRLVIQEEAIERLEHSVQAYQDERTRLEAAYRQLVSNLGTAEADVDGQQNEAGSERARGAAPGSPTSRRTANGPSGTDENTPR